MSTRAIIAMPTEHGYRTAWCWNDAFPDQLGKILKKKFRTETLVKELLDNVNFGSLMSEREKADFERDFPDNAGFIKLSNGYFLYNVKDKPVVGRGKHGHMDTIEEMTGQDLNYVYIFENGKWTIY